jgi:hypothetical protein
MSGVLAKTYNIEIQLGNFILIARIFFLILPLFSLLSVLGIPVK